MEIINSQYLSEVLYFNCHFKLDKNFGLCLIWWGWKTENWSAFKIAWNGRLPRCNWFEWFSSFGGPKSGWNWETFPIIIIVSFWFIYMLFRIWVWLTWVFDDISVCFVLWFSTNFKLKINLKLYNNLGGFFITPPFKSTKSTFLPL